jgi:SAM-dependent methyltransferase
MIDTLKPVTASSLPCKICGGATALYGVVDFHRSCLAGIGGLRLPLSGVPIYYRRCAACGFLFTDAFDDWSEAQFKKNIYNDEYLLVDPDYVSVRPQGNANTVIRLWEPFKASVRMLDFGGGNDLLCAALRAAGFPEAITYDPMVPEHAKRPDGKFDLVTSFETFEHLPDPIAGIGQVIEFMAEPGLTLFSTLVQPADFAKQGLNWWYVGPRNGHVSIFTRQALSLAWGRYGYKVISLNDNLHFAFRTLPPYVSLPSK